MIGTITTNSFENDVLRCGQTRAGGTSGHSRCPTLAIAPAFDKIWANVPTCIAGKINATGSRELIQRLDRRHHPHAAALFKNGEVIGSVVAWLQNCDHPAFIGSAFSVRRRPWKKI